MGQVMAEQLHAFEALRGGEPLQGIDDLPLGPPRSEAATHKHDTPRNGLHARGPVSQHMTENGVQ